ncbi:hypothetical protein [Rummeliibacillus pycnus]|uniref:hypothetical protein n=1 Tax=Rummeliibacillus pycnus TaxID=101070 RepID=UPI003D2BD261
MGEIIDYLISEMNKKGISSNHIEEMKDRVLVSDYEYSLFYDEISENKEHTIVEVKKIKGIYTGWKTANRSIYELFFSVTGELPTKDRVLNSSRIETNIISLLVNGIKYQYDFYVDATKEDLLRDGLPRFNYYIEDDIYFSGATHRTVSAIMFNAPKMVGYVTTYRKNPIKYNNYLKHNKTFEKWKLFLASEFNSIDIIKVKNRNYEVRLKKEQKIYFKFETPIIVPSNENLINTIDFEKEQKDMIELIQKLQDIDNALSNKQLGVLPLPLRVLKKWRLPFIMISSIYDYKNNNANFIDIDNSVDDIVRKIYNQAQMKTIIENLTDK